MKNLKKVLSLALAFAMVLGLCVTGMAAEDVTTAADWDSVTDKDSALLLNAFEIMEGSDEDGVLMFNPEGNVTRAQAAAMISRALWGGTDNPSLYANGNAGGYVDVVSGAWYMGYVNYMTVIGVMTGKGDGEFDPDGNVTGYELLKMALVAVGYDAEVEKLTGLGWDLRTMALATQRGYTDLTEGTTVTDWNAPLSRMNAAIIIANMIYREMVAYDEGKVYVVTYDNDGNPATAEVELTFGVEILGMTTKTGTLVANEYGVYEAVTAINPNAANYNGENAVVKVPATFDANGNPLTYKNVNVTLTSTIFDLGANVTLYLVDEGTNNETIVSAAVAAWDDISRIPDAATGKPSNDDATWAMNSFGTGTYTETKHLDLDWNGNVNHSVELKYGNPVKVTAVVEDETYGTVYMINKDKTWNTTRYERGTLIEGTDFVFAANTTGTAVEGSMVITASVVGTAFGAKDAWHNTYVLDEVEGKVTRIAGPSGGVWSVYIDGVQYSDWYWIVAPNASYGDEGIFYFAPDTSLLWYSELEESKADPTFAIVYDAGYEAWGSTSGLSGSTGVVVEVKAILEDGTNDTFEVDSVYYYGDDVKTVYLMEDQDEDTIKNKAGAMVADNGEKTNGLFYTSGEFYALWNADDDKKSGEALYVEYTLNEDGTINLIFDSHSMTTKDIEVVSGTTKTKTGEYLTANTVTFICTDTAKNTWTVVKGTGLTAGKYEGGVMVKEYLTATDKQITYMVSMTNPGDTGTAATFYYIVANNGAMGRNDAGKTLYEIDYFNTNTGAVETIETTKSVDANTYWEKIDENGEFVDSIDKWYKGFATTVTTGVIAITQADHDGNEEDAEIYLLDKDTVFYLVDGEETAEVELGDIAEQDLEIGFQSYGTWKNYWKTMVYAADDTTADIVIIYADLQTENCDCGSH